MPSAAKRSMKINIIHNAGMVCAVIIFELITRFISDTFGISCLIQYVVVLIIAGFVLALRLINNSHSEKLPNETGIERDENYAD
ncbi:MAG: hypothetical protein LUC26_05850 [Prevotella sp.]|nr:hypothetical protein [Prevotella sp.]